MRRMRGRPWYKKIADSLEEEFTFDLEVDGGGFPTIHWLIARHILSEHSDYEQFKLMESYTGQVKGNLNAAIQYLISSGIPVYRNIPKGKKAITVLTLDPDYKRARERNYDRIRRNVFKVVRAGGEELRAIGYDEEEFNPVKLVSFDESDQEDD